MDNKDIQIYRPKTLPTESEFTIIQRVGKTAILSNLLPDEFKRGTREEQLAKAVVVALKGLELGIPIMQSLAQIHVIKGKPALSAELMLVLIYREHPRAEINFVELSNAVCRIKAKRPGGEWCMFEFSIDDAKRAQLIKDGSGWTKYPRAMLRSRCVSEMARTLFPDALAGCSYTPEELGLDIDPEGNSSAHVEVQHCEIIEPSLPPNETTLDLPEPSDLHETTAKPPHRKASPSVEVNHEGLGQSFPESETPEPIPSLLLENPGAYVIPGGRFKDKRISDLSVSELEAIIHFVQSNGPQRNLGPGFLGNAEAYLITLEAYVITLEEQFQKTLAFD